MHSNVVVIILGVLALISIWIIIFTWGKKKIAENKLHKTAVKSGKEKDPIF